MVTIRVSLSLPRTFRHNGLMPNCNLEGQIVGKGWPSASLIEARRIGTVLGLCCSSKICPVKET